MNVFWLTKRLNEALERFNAALPEGAFIKNFYGKGDCVIVDSTKEIEKEAKWWAENS